MAVGDEEVKTAEASTPQKQSSGGSSGTEFEPPLACVRRMLKNTLPANTNVGKDACASFSRACGIFIVYLTACANDFARESKRQTITANDILAAVKEVDFDEFTPQLNAFIEQHRKNEKKKKAQKKSEELAKASTRKHDRDEEENEEEGEEDSSLSKKRQKIEDEEKSEAAVYGTPGDIDASETVDDTESLADASQDDGDSQANAEQDESNANDDSADENLQEE